MNECVSTITVGAALAEWHADLCLEDRASTASTYRRVLKSLGTVDQLSDLTPAVCRQLAVERQRSISPSGVRMFVAVLSSFLKWCVARGYASTNAAADIPKPRKRAPQRRYLTPDMGRKLYAAARTDRERLALRLMAGCGLRRAEVCGLRQRDCDLTTGLLRIYGKGKKWRTVYANPQTCALIAQAGDRIMPMEGDSLWRMVKRLGQRAGIDVHPHLLRHMFAAEFLDASQDAFSLQSVLGHADYASTSIYVSDARQRSAMKRMASLDMAARLFGD